MNVHSFLRQKVGVSFFVGFGQQNWAKNESFFALIARTPLGRHHYNEKELTVLWKAK
jgi:hypothetical protein